MEQRIETPGMAKRVVTMIASGALAVSSLGMPAAAFAVDPSAGEQTGTGATDVTVQLIDAEGEHGGTEDPTNPDSDDNGLGDNIAFTVPASINFVAKSDGTLIGPEAEDTYIENESVFAIHASSMDVDSLNSWNIVEDASASTQSNAVDFTFGPTGDSLKAYQYLEKTDVGDATKWNMTSKKAGDVTTDRVGLSTAGHIGNVDQGIEKRTKIAMIHTYVKPGTAVGANTADPSSPTQP